MSDRPHHRPLHADAKALETAMGLHLSVIEARLNDARRSGLTHAVKALERLHQRKMNHAAQKSA